jgi:hypothetical protein
MIPVIHDTTGSQTDCQKPLSRKKLRQLMPQNRDNLTSKALTRSMGRRSGFKLFSQAKQKRAERAKLRKRFSKHTLPDGTTFQLIPKPHEVEVMKPTVIERVSGLFAKLRKQFERQKAKGK